MPHRRTLELYQKAGVEYQQTTQDAVHARFEEETKGQPRWHRVHQIYRVRESGSEEGEEYLLYNLTTFSTDINGNEKSKAEVVGMHEEPVFRRTYNEDEHKTIVVGIQGKNVVYDIPATRENLEKILALNSSNRGGTPTKVNFVIKDGNQTYAGYTRDEFLNRSYEIVKVF